MSDDYNYDDDNPPVIPQTSHQLACLDESRPIPSAQRRVTITKQEHIGFRQRANYLEAQLTRAQKRIKDLEQTLGLKDAKIKDLRTSVCSRSLILFWARVNGAISF